MWTTATKQKIAGNEAKKNKGNFLFLYKERRIKPFYDQEAIHLSSKKSLFLRYVLPSHKKGLRCESGFVSCLLSIWLTI